MSALYVTHDNHMITRCDKGGTEVTAFLLQSFSLKYS